MSEATVEVANRHSTAKRVVLVLIGAGVIAWPLWDVWPGIASVNLVSPLFWIIALGAVGIGGILIGGAIFGSSTVLRIGRDEVILQRDSLVASRVERLPRDRIGAISVAAHDWSEKPTTWRVVVSLTAAKPVLSKDFLTMAEAEALADRLRLVLGRPHGGPTGQG